MSCGGNRFSCGIKRLQKPNFAPDRPSNIELHNENESRLSELMRLREEQDKALSFQSSTIQQSQDIKPSQETTTISTLNFTTSEETYYPWVQRQT